MRFVILTGISGAGKSTALRVLEDLGFFCVDNLPIQLIEKFADLSYSESNRHRNVAVSVDIRSGQDLPELESVMQHMTEKGEKYKILFLDASDEVLIKRFKETRRSHPLAVGGSVAEGLASERKKLMFLRRQADYIVDTSLLISKDLRSEIEKIFHKNIKYKNLYINIMSFGFKYGIPMEADLVFDVRFMPNPYYVPELKPKTGNDEDVQHYVMKSDVSKEFVHKLEDMIKFLIPQYVQEGRNQLVIAIGCTGGQHRSVTTANYLYEALIDNDSYGVKISHRDISK